MCTLAMRSSGRSGILCYQGLFLLPCSAQSASSLCLAGLLGCKPPYHPFACGSTLQKGAGRSHLRLYMTEQQHMCCLPSSCCLPPTVRIKGSSRGGEGLDSSRARKCSLALSRTEPCLPLHLAGRKGYCGWAPAIWDNFAQQI